MNIQEIFEKMNSGELAAHSELGTRDESKQSRSFGARIQKLKTVTGINARALVMKDVVLPFNPFTGVADDQYNTKAPFRPILLVSQTIEIIKMACKGNKELAAKWEHLLNGKFTKDDTAAMEDYLLFKGAGYIQTRVMTYSTVALDFAGKCGFSDYKTKYTVDPTELNEMGNYDYDNSPIHNQAAIFFNSMLKPEADKVVKALEKDGASKDTISKQRSAVYSKSPVKFVSPTNLVPFLFFPLKEMPKDIAPDNLRDLESCMRYYSKTDKWTMAFNEAAANPVFDEDMDFYDFTIKTPTSTDIIQGTGKVYTDEDSMELYQAMTITNTDGRMAIHGGSTKGPDGKNIKNEEVFAPILKAARDYFAFSQEQSGIDGGDTFEKIMAGSNKFRPISSVMDKFLPACNEVFSTTFANSPYFTDEVKRANAEFFTAMNPDNALALAAEDDDDLKAASDAQKSSVAALIAEAKPSDEVEAASDYSAIANMDIAEG